MAAGPTLLICGSPCWGFFVVSDQRLQDRIRQTSWISLAAGLALVVGFIVLTPDRTPECDDAGRLMSGGDDAHLRRLARGPGDLGPGHAVPDRPVARLDYANEAVLPFYILHQTVIVTVSYFVLGWGIPDLLEWATIGSFRSSSS